VPLGKMDFCKDGSQLGLYSQIWVNLTRDDGHFCYIFLWTVDPLKLHKEITKKKPTDRYSRLSASGQSGLTLAKEVLKSTWQSS